MDVITELAVIIMWCTLPEVMARHDALRGFLMQETSFSAVSFCASSPAVAQDLCHVLICMLAQELSMDLPHMHVLMHIMLK